MSDAETSAGKNWRCGAPLPWGTTCIRGRDHNDHTDGLRPRWHNGLDDVADLRASLRSLALAAGLDESATVEEIEAKVRELRAAATDRVNTERLTEEAEIGRRDATKKPEAGDDV